MTGSGIHVQKEVNGRARKNGSDCSGNPRSSSGELAEEEMERLLPPDAKPSDVAPEVRIGKKDAHIMLIPPTESKQFSTQAAWRGIF